MLLSRLTLFVLLLSTAVTACSYGEGDPPGPAVELFDGRPTVDAPASVALGVPFALVTRARPRFSGTGRVQLQVVAERVRVLSPVQDTLDFGLGDALTPPVTLLFEAGEPAETEWEIAVEDLPTLNLLNARVSARVEMDAVRADDGELLPVTLWYEDPDLFCQRVEGACGDPVPVGLSAPAELQIGG